MFSNIVISVFSGNIITFVAGTALTWSSPMLLDFQNKEQTPFDRVLTTEEASWISAMLPLGAIFGPFLYGFLADKIGRKTTLLIQGVPFFVCYLLLALAKVPWVFYVCRFIMGMNVGGIFTVTPIYIGEIAEDSNRGALGSSMNCFICFGFFFSHAVGSYINTFKFNMILAVFPAIFVVVFSLVATESPHYYVLKDNKAKAKMALSKIRKGKEEEAINQELTQMEEKIKEHEHGTFCDIFRSKGLTKAYIITVGLLAFQQFSGINAVLFYAEDIFKKAGSHIPPEICSIIVGCTQFLTSFLTPFVVDRLGRKILIVISAAGIVIAEVPLGVYYFMRSQKDDVSSMTYLPVVCLIWYIIAFNIGLAILPWSMMGELFPDNVKSIATSSATSITWMFGFIIAKYFHYVSNRISMGISFWIFASCCAASIPFTIFYVVETKGKSLQEIQDILNS